MEYIVDDTPCTEIMVARMVDDHVWVRQASSRLMGQFFAEIADGEAVMRMLEKRRDWLFTVVGAVLPAAECAGVGRLVLGTSVEEPCLAY